MRVGLVKCLWSSGSVCRRTLQGGSGGEQGYGGAGVAVGSGRSPRAEPRAAAVGHFVNGEEQVVAVDLIRNDAFEHEQVVVVKGQRCS